MKHSRSRRLAAASVVGLFFLYLFGLNRTGLLGPDEPRYAAVGRAMAATGDWITPRLWGQPWFEKPALLYWMTAIGFKAGLGPDLAPRIPVALASIAFLIYFFVAIRRAFGDRTAWYSSTILATSAAWLVYSHVAVTDLPLSATFAAAMLILLTGLPGARAAITAGVFLGLGILAKGLVPLVLFVPALWFFRRRVRDLAFVFVSAAVIAAPWYLLVTSRNGEPFIQEFFWKQHFGRFVSGELQHGQPVWFYLPVLLASLFPWTPLLALFNSRVFQDRRALFLLAWLLWGIAFFSASRNKLPGYLLPLMPPLAALLGIAVAGARERSRKVMAALASCGVLLCLIPPIDSALPQLLVAGFAHTPFHVATLWLIPAAIVAALAGGFEASGQRSLAVALVGVCMGLLVLRTLWTAYPELDRQVSARSRWISLGQSVTCVRAMTRAEHYGINYYAGTNIPDCK